jgi:predicted nucleic acid-binding Zn ribbon protein
MTEKISYVTIGVMGDNFCVDCHAPISKRAKRCSECRREHKNEEQRLYNKTSQGKATNKRYHQSLKGKVAEKRYEQSSKGKAVRKAALKRHLKTPKGKATQRRYSQSIKGKAKERRYRQSPKGKATEKLRRIKNKSLLG